jgi:tetrahydromethanopterin S-methyltransferase subunit G
LALQEENNRRFEQIDKRFDQVDKRFEQVDKRLDRVETSIQGLYTFMRWLVGSQVVIALAILTLAAKMLYG